MSALLIAGAIAALAGLGAIALGIPVKEFSFGNTMILSGTMGVCTGLILFGLSFVVGELRVIAHRLRLRVSTENGTRALSDGDNGELADLAVAPPVEDLWGEGGAPRGRGRPAAFLTPLPEPAAEPAPARPRRNLMFAAASRKERERAEKELADPQAIEFRSPPLGESDFGEQPAAEPAVTEPAPPAFDDAWPRPERSRATEPPPLQRRSARAAPAFGEAAPLAARDGEPSAVSVIKSGVVDGMAYSLYSDGSIEAQMPEGMMRFSSIDQLRTHLDQRG